MPKIVETFSLRISIVEFFCHKKLHRVLVLEQVSNTDNFLEKSIFLELQNTQPPENTELFSSDLKDLPCV